MFCKGRLVLDSLSVTYMRCPRADHAIATPRRARERSSVWRENQQLEENALFADLSNNRERRMHSALRARISRQRIQQRRRGPSSWTSHERPNNRGECPLRGSLMRRRTPSSWICREIQRQRRIHSSRISRLGMRDPTREENSLGRCQLQRFYYQRARAP